MYINAAVDVMVGAYLTTHSEQSEPFFNKVAL